MAATKAPFLRAADQDLDATEEAATSESQHRRLHASDGGRKVLAPRGPLHGPAAKDAATSCEGRSEQKQQGVRGQLTNWYRNEATSVQAPKSTDTHVVMGCQCSWRQRGAESDVQIST